MDLSENVGFISTENRPENMSLVSECRKLDWST